MATARDARVQPTAPEQFKTVLRSEGGGLMQVSVKVDDATVVQVTSPGGRVGQRTLTADESARLQAGSRSVDDLRRGLASRLRVERKGSESDDDNLEVRMSARSRGSQGYEGTVFKGVVRDEAGGLLQVSVRRDISDPPGERDDKTVVAVTSPGGRVGHHTLTAGESARLQAGSRSVDALRRGLTSRLRVERKGSEGGGDDDDDENLEVRMSARSRGSQGYEGTVFKGALRSATGELLHVTVQRYVTSNDGGDTTVVAATSPRGRTARHVLSAGESAALGAGTKTDTDLRRALATQLRVREAAPCGNDLSLSLGGPRIDISNAARRTSLPSRWRRRMSGPVYLPSDHPGGMQVPPLRGITNGAGSPVADAGQKKLRRASWSGKDWKQEQYVGASCVRVHMLVLVPVHPCLCRCGWDYVAAVDVLT